jgi:hypothetical protein
MVARLDLAVMRVRLSWFPLGCFLGSASPAGLFFFREFIVSGDLFVPPIAVSIPVVR